MQFLNSLFGQAPATPKAETPTLSPAPPEHKPKALIQMLIKNLGGYYPARSHEHVHASDLTKENFCPRQTALLDLTNKSKKDQYQTTAETVTYDLGNAVADLIRERWLGQAAIGNWVCQSCGAEYMFCTRPMDGCHDCKSGALKYEEVRFTWPEYAFSGGIDVLVDTGAPKYKVVEIKIIAPDQFEKLQAPLAEHRIRTNLYLQLIANSGHPVSQSIDTERGKVLYVSRAWGKMHPQYEEVLPFKEFEVESNADDVAGALHRAAQVKRWRDKGVIPVGICPNSFCPAAKKCSVVKECWSGKYPGMTE